MFVLIANLLLIASLSANGSKYGYVDTPFNFQARYQNIYKVPEPPSPSLWEEIWTGNQESRSLNVLYYKYWLIGVPDYNGEIPKHQARIQYPFGVTVWPNETVDSGKLEANIQILVAGHPIKY